MIIGRDGVRMDPVKIQAIQEWETPTNVKEVLSFLGFGNFYRRFITAFSKLSGPLTELTKKDAPWKWDDKCQKTFQDLKDAFAKEPVLRHYDPDDEIQVEVDASDQMVGGVLSQKDENGVWKPVAYFSSKMIAAELNYQIYDKELLAIVRAFEEWRPKLEGSKFPIQVISDHKNLEYFMSSKLLNRRQARWSEFLSRFNFIITYRPGNQNNAADALSRQPEAFPKKGEVDTSMLQQVLKKENFDDELRANYQVASIHLRSSSIDEESIPEPEDSTLFLNDSVPEDLPIDSEETPLEDQFQEACDSDADYRRIFKALRDGEPRKIKGFPLAECELVNDQVYYRGQERRLVPKDNELRLRLMCLAHDTPLAGHPGAHRCYDILQRNYFWLDMIKDVRHFTNNCHTCRKTKYSRNKYSGALKPLPIPERRWADISVDFVVGLPPSKND